MSSVAAAMRVAIIHSSKWSRSLRIIFPTGQTAKTPTLSSGRFCRGWLIGRRDFLLDRRDPVLSDPITHLFVYRVHRRAQRIAFGFRRFVEHGLPGRLHRRQRVIVVLLRDLVGVDRRLLHRLVEAGADAGGQPFPELLVDDHRVAEIAVVGKRRVALYLEHLLRVHVRRRVLGPVDDPVCKAWYTSEKAITCGIAPRARICASSTFED